MIMRLYAKLVGEPTAKSIKLDQNTQDFTEQPKSSEKPP